jgi:uroporphyrinogen decarboxylase
MMTSRERLLAVLRGEIPDCAPCDPDISNMVPCRLTGKPFWDIYVFEDPPLWRAYIEAAKHFDIDGGMEIYNFGPVDVLEGGTSGYQSRIVMRREDGSFVTQDYYQESDTWSRYVTVHTADNPPATNVLPEKVGLPPVPREWEEIKGVRPWPTGIELWNLIRKELGDQGILGLSSGASTLMLDGPDDVYSYYDDPRPWRERTREAIRRVEARMEKIAKMNPRPDFLMCGGSGTLVWQTVAIFRELALPVLKRTTEMAYDLGLPTHVHSCGPEAALVAMAAEETKLTVIDPLELPPMGDCNLAHLKARFGRKLVLKGNLHTTEVMLRGSVEDVIAASKKAIDDAASGGRFILSTGDQCGRDTPEDNIRAMVETARTYGRY